MTNASQTQNYTGQHETTPVSSFGPTILLLVGLFLFTSPGLLLNTFIIVVTIIKKQVKEYKWFLFNVSVFDLIFCFVLCFIHPFYVLSPKSEGFFCGLAGFFTSYAIRGMISSLFPLAWNRYMALYHSHKYPRIFNNRSSPLICLGIHCFTLLLISIPLGTVYSSYGRSPYKEGESAVDHFCTVQYSHSYPILSAVHNFTLLGVFVTQYCAFTLCAIKIYKKVKYQQTLILSLNQEKRLKENTELLKVTVVQGVLPLVGQASFLIYFIAQGFGLHENDYFAAVAMVMFTSNPLLDALTTVRVIKPYREAMKALVNKFRGKNQVVSPHAPQVGVMQVPPVPLHPVRNQLAP